MEGAWKLILKEVLNGLKPYLDVEVDVLIEETLFTVTKDSKETMNSYVSRKLNKKRELSAALGQETAECSQCKFAKTSP